MPSQFPESNPTENLSQDLKTDVLRGSNPTLMKLSCFPKKNNYILDYRFSKLERFAAVNATTV